MFTAAPPAAAEAAPSEGAAPTRPSAAYFTSLTLRNVRCFGDDPVTLDLTDGETPGGLKKPAQWTVLLGENGTGKTTVLETVWALHGVVRGGGLVVGPATLMLSKLLRDPDPYDPLKNDPLAQTLYALASFPRRGFEEQAEITLEACGGRLNSPTALLWRQRFRKGEIRQPTASPDEFPTRLYGVNRLRAGLSRGLGSGRAVGIQGAEEWLKKLDYARLRTRNPRDEQRYERATQMICDLLPDVTAVEVADNEDPDYPEPRVWLRVGSEAARLPLSRLAFGYQTVFALAIDHAARLVMHHPDSPNPLAEPAVVLVDEIELHLHPKMQREVMGKLSDWFPQTQFIVTTHSPLIAQAAAERRANFAVLSRERDAAGNPVGPVRIQNDPAAAAGWRLDQFLSSDLFDVPAVPPEAARLLRRRRELLAKPEPTPEERAEADRLREELEELPSGTSPEEASALNALRDAVELLKQQAATGTPSPTTTAS